MMKKFQNGGGVVELLQKISYNAINNPEFLEAFQIKGYSFT
jgi:hypothetical protein